MGKIIQTSEEIKKPDRKSLWYLAVVLIIAIVVCVALIYYFSKPTIKEIPSGIKPAKSMEEIIKSLTAPTRETEPISEELREAISASSKETNTKTSEEILKSLTAPE